jgi:hypothetical protein
VCFSDHFDSIRCEENPKYFIYIRECTAIKNIFVAETLPFVQVLVVGTTVK